MLAGHRVGCIDHRVISFGLNAEFSVCFRPHSFRVIQRCGYVEFRKLPSRFPFGDLFCISEPSQMHGLHFPVSPGWKGHKYFDENLPASLNEIKC